MNNFINWFQFTTAITTKKNYIWKVLKKENSLDNALYGAKYDTISRSNENDVYNKWIW